MNCSEKNTSDMFVQRLYDYNSQIDDSEVKENCYRSVGFFKKNCLLILTALIIVVLGTISVILGRDQLSVLLGMLALALAIPFGGIAQLTFDKMVKAIKSKISVNTDKKK